MRGCRVLTGVGVACAGMLVPATAVPASTNDVLADRIGIVRLTVTPVDLAPPECAHLPLTAVVVPGAPGTRGAKIQGTRDADLILGTPGDDRLVGHAGDDCLVGGPGVDELDGGQGSDVCLTDDGDTPKHCEA